MPVLTYGGETMVWREKERSRIRAVHMNNLRALLGIRRMDRVPNGWEVFFGGWAIWKGWRGI